MGVTTRSKSSHRDAEERRQFLEEGAAAARTAAQAGPPFGTHNPEVSAPATPLAVPAEEAQERRPGASSTHDDLREAHRPFARLMSDEARDSPRSPSIEYEAALGKKRAPTQIPLEPVGPLQAVLGEEHASTQAVQPCMHSPTQAALGKMRAPSQAMQLSMHAPTQNPLEAVQLRMHAPTQAVQLCMHSPTQAALGKTRAPTQNPRIVTFSGTPRRAESVRSKISSTTEARRQAAELEATEQLAEIRRQQLQLEADLVKKRLETKLSQIDAEASVHDDASSIDNSERVQEWLNNSQQGDPTPQKRTRVDEAPPDYTTPKRPLTETEQRARKRSFVREDRDISPVPEPHTPYTTRTQEGTIAESMVHLFEKMQMAARPAPKDIYELPAFYGDVGEWRSFINTYTETARRYGFSDYENVARLRTALRGEAKACVQHVLSTATRPDLIIRILKKQFGRSEVLLDRAIDDLRRMQPVGPGAHDLNAFAIKVMNVVSTVMDLDKRHYADNPMLIREVTDRLSPHLRSRWCEYAKAHQDDEDPEILQLADFLMQESEQEMKFCHARAPVRTRTSGARTEPSSNARPVGGRLVPVPRPHTGPARPRDTTGRSREGTGAVPKYSYSITENNCLFCGGRHSTQECRKLASKSLGERWDWARLNSICYKCMNAKHRRNHCREKGCSIAGCPQPHHKLLHSETTEPQAGATETTPAPPPRSNESSRPPARTPSAGNPREGARTDRSPRESTTADGVPRAFTSITSHDVLLKVLPVTLTGPGGTAHIYAMLDDGSTISLLEEDIADQIGAYGPQAPLNVRGIGGISHRSHTQTVKAVVRPARGGTAHDLTLRTVSGLGLRSQTIDKERLLNYEHLRDLGEYCYTTGVPQMLIGADHWHLLVPTEIRMGQRNEPAAIKVSLGWVFFGIMPRITQTNEQTTMHCRAYEDDNLDELMKKHWAIEALGVSSIDHQKPSDQRAVAIFNDTVRKTDDGYEVGQLWTSDKVKLPPSYAMAYSRLKNLESKMDKDPVFQEQYSKHIANLLEKGYAEELTDVPVSEKVWFLPHFSVYNANKRKHRAVFDCAAKSQGHALNDYVLQGPDLLKSLVGILLRFREQNYAITADIQEMFLRVRLRKEDAVSQLFLWRGARRDCAPTVYRLNRVCFGCVSSPFLAHAVRNRNAEDNSDVYPEAVEEIRNNHYMDDYVASYETEEDLLRVAQQVRQSHAQAGFKLRSYATNSQQMLDMIEPELRANEPTALGEKEQKVLGMVWDPGTDSIGYNTQLLRVSDEVKSGKRAPTKRELLSVIMSIYDPIGLISHYVISAKILYQQVWLKCTSWDESLPEKEAKMFFQWLHALRSVATLRIPRRYPTTTNPIYTLHVFSDASTEAYCATVYWRAEGQYEGDVQVSLAAAKSRVCPLKVLTVPKLELSAAIMGLRLARTIVAEQRYEIASITYWSDSKTVLSWIKDDARLYKPFVSHRLSEIAENSDRQAWRWVPTKLNPADAGTRCKPDRHINIDDMWYQGPSFLRLPETEWPADTSAKEEDVEPPEKKRSAIAATYAVERIDPATVLPAIERFSNYDKLINATAYVLLFVEKLKTKNKSLQLELRHIKNAEHMWLQNSQRRSFPEEIKALARREDIDRKSRLYKLAPELCEDGVIRMKTRLGNAPVIYQVQRPVILDGRDPLCRLIIMRAHRRSAHVHNEAVINALRQKYWILHLRPAVKAVARTCALCKVRRANPYSQPLGDLPSERLQAYQRPFTYAAQDYMGPLQVTIGRRREKRWIALYTCLSTRAVHLECVHSLSSDSAILALRRFAARRGWPRVMYSDNATCFRAAAVELREAYREWLPQLRQYGLREQMDWKFIPPGNPSAGGAWERMIRTVKTAMTYTLHTKAPREELLLTVLAEIENIVNHRPITHVPADHDSPEALTPAHFLLLQGADLPVLGACDEGDRKQWKAAQAMADHFWRRWVAEYLPLLAPRQSSNSGGRQIQVGDVVIVADPNGPRNTWPKGLVVATYPGPDQRTRSVDIRTSHGTLRRPTCRLAVIASQPLQQ